jgi:hypothetical protein
VDDSATANGATVPEGQTEGNWIQAALGDWLNLLQGPQAQAFIEGVKTSDWFRVFRLLVVSLFLAGLALGTSYIKPELTPNFNTLVLSSKPAMLLILGAAGFAVLYQLFASAFRIQVTLPQSFFAIVLLGLPWLPLMALAESFFYHSDVPLAGIIAGFGAQFFVLAAIFNFGRGVKQISNGPAWRIWLSLVIPVLLVIYLTSK